MYEGEANYIAHFSMKLSSSDYHYRYRCVSAGYVFSSLTASQNILKLLKTGKKRESNCSQTVNNL